MDRKINILILEDNPSDAKLIKRELQKAGIDFTEQWSKDKATFLVALDTFVPDLILSDYSLPGFDGLAALAMARKRFPEIPVVIVSGAIGEETAIEALKAGATDYVLKQRLERLGPVVHRALQEAQQVAERKRSDQALRVAQENILQAKEEWERTFDSIPDLITILDNEQHILRANRSMAERLGCTPEQCVGQICYLCVHALNYRPGFCPHPLTLADGQQHVAEVYEPRLGGYFLVSTNPLRNPQGQVIGVVHVARDITERKRLEGEREKLLVDLEQRVRDRTLELEATNQELRGEIEENARVNQALTASEARLRETLQEEQAMRQQLIQSEKYSALARLVASVAHELNNPIQTIQNCMFLLKMDLDGNQSAQDTMEMATTEALRIARLVEQLRETYRPARSHVPEVFNVVDLLVSVSNILEPHLKQSNTHISIEAVQDRIQVKGITDQIKQVFLNICLNAIEAMQPGGGSLMVHAYHPEKTNYVAITFQDSGLGIPEENLSRIFEPFFTTKSKGTGLGLSICYEIMQDHGGKITVDSQPGEGTTFTVWLPEWCK